jgi:hypothetical protein
MPQIPTQQYTARDYQSTMDALVTHLRAKFPDGNWEKMLDQDVPLAMLSSLAWMHEQDAFYMNRRWLNTYLSEADDREPVIFLTKQLGYRMRPRTAASVAVRAVPQPTKAVQIVIPAGTKVPYEDTFFEFLEDATVPAFASSWPDETSTEVIVVTEGESKEITFESDGQPWQEFEVPFENVIEGSVVVTVAGSAWEEVSSLIYVEGDTLGRDIASGDGTDSQTVVLSLLNAIIEEDNADRLTVLVDGVEWAYVSAFTGGPQEFLASQAADGTTTVTFGLSTDGSAPVNGAVVDILYLISGAQRRYSLRYNQDDQPTISFGDDETGKIPPIGAQIVVSCRVGGGVVGNIGIGDLDTTVTGFLNEAPAVGEVSESTEVRIFNYSRGTGGNPREAIDRAKQLAPSFAKANQRAVTMGDWETIAASYYDPRYGAPAHAAAKIHQEVPESNLIDVSLWSRDSDGRLAAAGESLKVAVANLLNSKRTICTYLQMVDGVTYYFDVALAVSLKQGFFTTTVFSNLQAAVINFFDSALVLPGRDIRINELYRRLNAVEGVYSVTIESIIGTVQEEQNTTADGASQTYEFLFSNPIGQEIVPTSFQVVAGTQTISDDGTGGMTGDIDSSLTNSIEYDTGRVTVSFNAIPVIGENIRAEARYYAKLEWEEDKSADFAGLAALDEVAEYFPIIKRPPMGVSRGVTLDFYLPTYLLPIVPGRCFFITGYGGTIAGGTGVEKNAYDDGDGNIVGDVDPTGVNTIDYRTGRVQLTWDTSVHPIFPFSGGQNSVLATLSPNADGVETDFTFSWALPGWWVLPSYAGSLNLDFSGFPSWGAEAQIYDNFQTQLWGTYLDNRGDSVINETARTGTLHFSVPPQSPGAPPHQFSLWVRQVTQVIYSSFVFSVKDPVSPGHDSYLFADNTGKLWGTTPDSYPTSRLDHRTGHIIARLSSPIVAGRTTKLSYDAFLRSKSRNIPIVGGAIGTFSQTTIRELEEEIDL